MSDFDVVIRNGSLVDDTGSESVTGDIAILDGKIAQIGTVAGTGREEIDASNMAVAPGFIDIHTHF